MGAHRVAYALSRGIDPLSLTRRDHIRHSCDNRPCGNPRHLSNGTTQQNTADRVARKRSATGLRNGMHTHPEKRPRMRGERNGMAKISDVQADQIGHLARSRTMKQRDIAKLYGVSQALVSLIARGRRGRAVPSFRHLGAAR